MIIKDEGKEDGKEGRGKKLKKFHFQTNFNFCLLFFKN